MKYIKLYEGFDTDVITNTIKFLTKKLGNRQGSTYLNTLKRMISDFNVPISRIKEDDIVYTRKDKAIIINNIENVSNSYEIYCIKHWFSLEKGYLGKTCTGNLKTPYTLIKRDYSLMNQKFDFEQLDHIKNVFGIKKGKLKPVLDYSSDLKTGDDVIMILDGRKWSTRDLVLGKIYIEDNEVYILQNEKNGQEPKNIPNFGDNYSLSWSLGDIYDINTYRDNYQLHKYIKDDKPIRIIKNKVKKVKHKPNIADYNKVLNGNDIEDWTFGNQKDIKNVIEDSDFAIIIYLDKLLKKGNINSIRSNRTESRNNALALMSDNEVRKININNYTDKIISKQGLDSENVDFSKLNKIVSNIFGDKFILNNLICGGCISRLEDFNEYLYNMLNSGDKDTLYWFNMSKDLVKRARENTKKNIKLFNTNLNTIYKLDNEEFNLIINRFMELGQFINSYINNLKLESVHDLIILSHNLRLIEIFLDDYKYKLPSIYNNIIQYLDSRNCMRYINRLEEGEDYNDTDFSQSMRKIDIIEKYIYKLLK